MEMVKGVRGNVMVKGGSENSLGWRWKWSRTLVEIVNGVCDNG